MKSIEDEGLFHDLSHPSFPPINLLKNSPHDSSSKQSLISLFTQKNEYLERYLEDLITNTLSKTSISTTILPSTTTTSIQPDMGNFNSYLEEISKIIPYSTLVSSPRQIGHMTSLLPTHTKTISTMITSLNQNMVKVETSASLTTLEKQVIKVLCQEYGMNDGIICSGGTVANLTALWMARGKEVGGVVVGSEMLHYSIRKSCDILGLEFIPIQTETNFTISISQLTLKVNELVREGRKIVALVGIAGTTETGSFDNFISIINLARIHSLHVHIDAAWGGPVMFSKYQELLLGCQQAHTITIDGHKQFYTPLGCGMLLVKEGMERVMMEAEYIIRKGSGDLGRFGVEGSRPAVVLYLHANLKILGREGLRGLIEMGCGRTREMYNRLKMFPGGVFECVNEPMSNILLYRYIPLKYRGLDGVGSGVRGIKDGSMDVDNTIDWVNERIQELSKSSIDPDMIFTSRTRVTYNSKKSSCLRVVISNPLTTFEIIERGIRAQLRVARRVERELEVKGLDVGWKGVLPIGLPWDL